MVGMVEDDSAAGIIRVTSEDEFEIDIDVDCVKTNSLDCRTLDNRDPSDTEVKCCYPRKEALLRKYKPKVILLLGNVAVKSFYGCDPVRRSTITPSGGKILSMAALRGKVFPDFR